jgi:serine/threonine protein kinase
MAETLRDGRYTIVRVLGEGSQASTFEATDARDGKSVAVKRFAVRNAKVWKEVELAEREARVLASLSHPKLPAYVEHFEEKGALYLVMERIAGVSLSEFRRRGAVFREEDAIRLLEEASGVLAYLHSRTPPIIHRDLKPGNVIRRPDGSFAFVDFGAVRDKLREEGGSTIVGTFGYMAPEQFQGRALPQSDVYAVGATVLWMLTGDEPENLPHKGLKIDVPAALGKRASPTLVAILSRMLEPDPETRPRSIAPLLGGFEVHGEKVRQEPVAKPAAPSAAIERASPRTLALLSRLGEGRDDPVTQSLFRILRRFLPIFWVMSALAWWWLPWTVAMTFLVGLVILSIATSEYAPKGKGAAQRMRFKRMASHPSVRLPEPQVLVKQRVGDVEAIPVGEDSSPAITRGDSVRKDRQP